jgi:hypothetical protein
MYSQKKYYWDNRDYILKLKKEKLKKDPEYAEKVRKYNREYYQDCLSNIYIKCDACDIKLLRHGYRHHKKTKKHYENMIRILENKNIDKKYIDSYPKPRLRPNELQRKYNKTYYEKHSEKVKERSREYMRKVRKENKMKSKIDHDKPFLTVIKLY